MATLEEIKQFSAKAEKAEKAGTLRNIITVEKYVNKNDASDTFQTLEEAFKKGLNLADYRLEKQESGLLIELKNLLTKDEINTIRNAAFYINLLDDKTAVVIKSDSKLPKASSLSVRLNKELQEFKALNSVAVAEKYMKTFQQRIEANQREGKTTRGIPEKLITDYLAEAKK